MSARPLLRDVPIERRLILITMLSSTVALLLACCAFAAYELTAFRRDIVADLSSVAAMVGDSSSSAIEFQDRASAQRTLDFLANDPHVIGAVVYDTDANVFASYARAARAAALAAPAVRADGHRFANDHVELFRGIDLAGERVGTVYIRADLDQLYARLRQYSLIVIMVMGAASLAAYLLSRKLNASISGPICALANIVGAVSAGKDYSIRAPRQGADETGRLIDGFNEMLEQIQARDNALAAAHRDLERRVEERTRELQLEVLERQRAEAALRAQQERTRLIVDKAFDAIISADASGNIIEWNAQAESIFGWSRAEAVGRNLADTIIPPRYREAHAAGLLRLAGGGEERILNKRIEIHALARDGREVPVELAITPICVGGTHLFNAFLRDVTERKKGEADLADAHKQLLDISRQAGMAEVATSVLHNVGNVLNSVNVSASLIAEHVRQSKAPGLARLADLLREHERDLGAFFAADPRGRHVVPHLVNLGSHLRAEQAAVIGEIESLHANIEHIKDIVTMQQGYARISGVKEVVRVADLVEDSLRLNAGALTRHGVEVVREFQDDLTINVDKHKVLQILVNLIRNAKYACDDSGRTDKRVTLRIDTAQQCVRIAVADNGIGIEPENLTRIFGHGFTTRKEGHGFGLHSGALAARELGGSLSVHSEGAGRGACFVLELPLQPAEVAACA